MEINADQSTGRHRRRHHHHRKHSAFLEFVLRNKLDLSIAFLFLFGIFLLVERMEIKETVWAWMRGWVMAIYVFIADLFGTVGGLEGSDLIGISLIILALVLLTVRTRRILIANHPALDECPICGGELYRTHRQTPQRVLESVLSLRIKNYSCKDCDFTGQTITRRSVA